MLRAHEDSSLSKTVWNKALDKEKIPGDIWSTWLVAISAVIINCLCSLGILWKGSAEGRKHLRSIYAERVEMFCNRLKTIDMVGHSTRVAFECFTRVMLEQRPNLIVDSFSVFVNEKSQPAAARWLRNKGDFR